MENTVKEARLRSPRLCGSISRTAQTWLNWGGLVELKLVVAAKEGRTSESKLRLCGGGATPTVLYTAPAPRHEASGIYSGMLGSLLGCFIII